MTAANADLTIPWVRVSELVVVFTSAFDATPVLGDFVLTGIPGTKFDPLPVPGLIPTITAVTADGPNAVRLTLSHALEPSILTLDVLASQISSGGIFGTDYDQTFLALPGDVDASRRVLGADAGGVSSAAESRVVFKHALRNALIPIATLAGLYLPFLFSGAVFIETVFAWPGMGRLIVDAITARDYPVVMGASMAYATMVVVGNLLADLLYAVIDPRIRHGRT